MSSIITRLFESHEQARAAVAELKRYLADDWISVVSAPQPAAGSGRPGTDSVLEALMAAEVPATPAKAFAERVRGGATAVVARAPFGFASTAIDVLDRFRPIATGIPDSYKSAGSKAAPFSDGLGLPTLSSDPAPISTLLGMGVLARGETSQSRLVDDPAPLSNSLRLPLLTSGPESKSSSFGMPLLSNKAAPFSGMLGLPLLTRRAGARNSSFGLPLLSDNPAPFSALFGLPVLLRD